MSSAENLVAGLVDDDVRHLPLKVEHTSGKVVTDAVAIVQNAKPSQVMADIRETAKGNMTRAEKVGLVFRLHKMKVYTEPIPSVSLRRTTCTN